MLDSTAITDEGAGHLAQMTGLRSLHLRDTAITDDGVMLLKGLVALELLDLGPNVTENAARELKACLPNCLIIGTDPAGANSFFISGE